MEYEKKLNAILEANAKTRVNGKVASERTHTAAKETLRTAFKLLVRLGYKVQDPANLEEKHVKAAVVQILDEERVKLLICAGSSCSKHRCPDFGRSPPLSCQIS